MPQETSPSAHAETIPVSPTLLLLRDASQTPEPTPLVDGRVLRLCGISIALGIAAAFVSQLLVGLIALITNLSFFGRLSWEEASPAENQLGLWVMVVPV